MKYRQLGQSGLAVSEIGFGGWGIGGRTAGATSYGDTDDAQSRRALSAAVDQGITFFDTAPAYGDGHSESLMGEVLSGHRGRVIIATKAGQDRFSEAPDFSWDGLRRSLEGSLRRLRTDCVDLLQLHSPPLEVLGSLPDLVGVLETFRAEGKIRHFGLSVKAPTEVAVVLEHCRPAVLQINLNMLDWRAVECGALDHAVTLGVGVVARTPLCFGFLSGAVTGETRFAPGDHRSAWPRERLLHWTEGATAVMAAANLPTGQTWAQAALRFCLSFPAVSTVIPGILSVEEVCENAACSDLGPFSPAVLDDIVAAYRDLGL